MQMKKNSLYMFALNLLANANLTLSVSDAWLSNTLATKPLHLINFGLKLTTLALILPLKSKSKKQKTK